MLVSRLLLILTALVWGATFIAQRMSADLIGPNTFNSVRFFLGAAVLTPLLYVLKPLAPKIAPRFSLVVASCIAGTILFGGIGLQQYAIAFTTASKSAFLTALYIVFVPLADYLLREPIGIYAILGAIVATAGASLLTLHGDGFSMAWGDLVTLISTGFWTAHILVLNNFSKRYDPIKLSIGQFLVCAIWSTLAMVLLESPSLDQVHATLGPILWSGIVSAGIGYTAQLWGQRGLPPTESSLILSLEMVFAALIAYFVLGERLSSQELWGILAMSIGVVLAQIPAPPQLSFGRSHDS